MWHLQSYELLYNRPPLMGKPSVYRLTVIAQTNRVSVVYIKLFIWRHTACLGIMSLSHCTAAVHLDGPYTRPRMRTTVPGPKAKVVNVDFVLEQFDSYRRCYGTCMRSWYGMGHTSRITSYDVILRNQELLWGALTLKNLKATMQLMLMIMLCWIYLDKFQLSHWVCIIIAILYLMI